jgi:PAS domain S-box-containing protein
MKFLKPRLPGFVLASALVISIFTLLFAAGISYKQLQMASESEKMVVNSYRISVALQQLDLDTRNAETNQRGYLLTNDSSFLQSYFEAIQKVNQSTSQLDSLMSDNYQQSRLLDTLTSSVAKRINYLNEVLRLNNYKVTSTDTIKSLILKGRELMNISQTYIYDIKNDELKLLKRSEMLHENDIKLPPFLILFIVLFSLFVFIISFYKINSDLKDLAITNNQLLINNELFEHSEQIADISHWYLNIKENELTYSNNLYRLLGCKAGEFEPTFLNFLEFVHPDDRALVVEGNRKILDESLEAQMYYRIIRKDGVERHFRSMGKVISDTFGNKFSIGINADITEQHSKDKLIEEKIADLERSNKQLKTFNHIASHDLQEPVRKVQTFISRISDKELEVIPENVRDYITGIGKAAGRMQKFIEDMLLYSKTSMSDKVYETADLNEILENSKRDLSQLIEEKNVIFNTTSLPTVNAIPFQIQQLFNNLISNAIKYSRQDIVPIITIDSKLALGKDIPNTRDNTEKIYYEISFSDNGIGFEQRYAEKIFDLFFRLHTNSEYSGTGIGLSICKVIVENHRGYIKAESLSKYGSTFSIYLPA